MRPIGFVRFGFGIAVGWALVCAARAAAAQGGSFAPKAELGGRVQTQFNTSSRPAVAPYEWALRRVWLEARVTVAPTVQGKIQVDFAPG